MVRIYKNLHDRNGSLILRRSRVARVTHSLPSTSDPGPSENQATDMDAKPVFDCLLGAFLFGELLRFDLYTVRNRMIFYGNFATSNRNFQFEFARACCQVTEVMAFILPNKTR